MLSKFVFILSNFQKITIQRKQQSGILILRCCMCCTDKIVLVAGYWCGDTQIEDREARLVASREQWWVEEAHWGLVGGTLLT